MSFKITTARWAMTVAALALSVGPAVLPARAASNLAEQHPYLVNPDGNQSELFAGNLCLVCTHQFIVSANGESFSIVIDDEIVDDGLTVPYEMIRGEPWQSPFKTGCLPVGEAKSFSATADKRDIRVNIRGWAPEHSGCTARGWLGIATVTIST